MVYNGISRVRKLNFSKVRFPFLTWELKKIIFIYRCCSSARQGAMALPGLGDLTDGAVSDGLREGLAMPFPSKPVAEKFGV